MDKYCTIIRENIGERRWEDIDVIKLPNGKEIDMVKLLDDQHRAKTALNHLAPWMSGFISRLRFVYTFRVKTQATDGFNIFVNPEFTSNLDLTEKVFVMAHEIMHCVLNHLRRGKNHDPHKSNIAADYEVNDTLVEMGLFKSSTITKIGALYDSKYNNWGYEKIYDANPNDPTKDSMDNSGNSNGSNSNDSTGGSNDSNGSSGSNSNDSTDGSNDSNGSNGGSENASGSDFESPSGLNGIPDTPGGMISREDGKKIAEAEGYNDNGPSTDSLADQWAEITKKVADQGKMPGSVKAKVDSLYKTSHDWKKELRRIIGHSLSQEDKRQAYANKNVLVAQSRIARTDKDKYDNVDYIMAWIDSSGSMTDDNLKRVLTELYSMALAKKPIKLVVIQCDTKIQDIKEYTNIRDLQKDIKVATVKGRGGTELKPCWDLLKTDNRFKRIKPELIMIFTDGYLNQYKRDIKHMNNLCWCILDNPGWRVQYKDTKTMAVHLCTEDF